jgi:hypothetical protein
LCNGALSLDGFEGKGGDPREQTKNQQGGEASLLLTHLVLFFPAVSDLQSFSRTICSVEIMAKRDTSDHVESSRRHQFARIDLDGAAAIENVRRELILKNVCDVINVGAHLPNVFGVECGSYEGAHLGRDTWLVCYQATGKVVTFL